MQSRLEPFTNLSQVPPMGGLKSIAVVIQSGSVPDISHREAVSLMDRSPKLVQLDIVSMGGKGKAFVRSTSGKVHRSQNILCRPCFQDRWF